MVKGNRELNLDSTVDGRFGKKVGGGEGSGGTGRRGIWSTVTLVDSGLALSSPRVSRSRGWSGLGTHGRVVSGTGVEDEGDDEAVQSENLGENEDEDH